MIEHITQFSESILFGFGVYTFGSMLIKQFLSVRAKKLLATFDTSVCVFIPVISVFYLLVSMQFDYTRYTTLMANPMAMSTKTALQQAFWRDLGIRLILIIPTQLLWFQKLRNIWWLRLLIAFTCVISVESVMWVYASQRNYLPATWHPPVSVIMGKALFSTILFTAVACLFHFAILKMRRKSID